MLSRQITAGDQLVLDTSALIAYLKGDEPASAVAADILDGLVATERNPGVIAAVSAAELLVRPYATSERAVATVMTFLIGFPGLSIRSTDLLVAAEAARIRADTGITTPDAIVAATASMTSSRWLITNDRFMRDRLERSTWGTAVLLLDDLARDGHPSEGVGA
jgi:predicted nucleic acid-binding protein